MRMIVDIGDDKVIQCYRHPLNCTALQDYRTSTLEESKVRGDKYIPSINFCSICSDFVKIFSNFSAVKPVSFVNSSYESTVSKCLTFLEVATSFKASFCELA